VTTAVQDEGLPSVPVDWGLFSEESDWRGIDITIRAGEIAEAYQLKPSLAVSPGSGKSALLAFWHETSYELLTQGFHHLDRVDGSPWWVPPRVVHAISNTWEEKPDRKCSDTEPRFWELDSRIPLERELDVSLTALRTPLEPARDLKQPFGRLNRLYRAAKAAVDNTLPVAERLVKVAALILRRIIKIIGRLCSIRPDQPDELEPPGQLVTAQPHVTRGPTSRRAAMFLSAPRRPVSI
jgi:hypothetical protein